jgi:hypothetical protein
MTTHSEWKVVYKTNQSGDAQIVAGRLEHEGIPTVLDHMTGRDAIGITIGNWGEIRVLVPPEQYDLANEILSSTTGDIPNNDE